MSYKIDKDLQEGMTLLAEGKKIDQGIKLVNLSARKGETKGKSFFEVGRIIREGVPGLEPNPEESRLYYDAAMNHFRHEKCDSMDYREMGDYYYFGLGTEPVNVNRALEYYDMAAKDGDELAKERAEEIRNSQKKGTVTKAPSLSPETEVKEVAKEEAPAEEEKPAEEPVAEEPAPVEEEKPAEEPVAEQSTPVEEEKPAEETVAEKPVEAVVAEEEKIEPSVVVAPVVSSEAKPVVSADKAVNEEINADQLLIRAIRLLDSDASSQQDKLDGLELCKAAAEEGSLRANVLLGYIYEGENSVVEGDYEKSRMYYEAAINLSSATALFRLGKLYLESEAPYFDEEKGHQMIVESARKGYAFALAYLGDCFRLKVDDPKNLDLAYRYYALAGERGLGLGYHNMAEIDCSRQETQLAKMHEKLAAENGYDPEVGMQDPLFFSLHI